MRTRIYLDNFAIDTAASVNEIFSFLTGGSKFMTVVDANGKMCIIRVDAVTALQDIAGLYTQQPTETEAKEEKEPEQKGN